MKLLQADKLTHFAVGALLIFAALPLGWLPALAICALLAVLREVYGWWGRGRTMTRLDAKEHLLDIGFTLGGGTVVLVSWAGGWFAVLAALASI